MLQNLSKDIRECYHRAEECRHKAQTASTELMKANFLQMEQRWLSLARSYEVTESVSEFHRVIQDARAVERISRRIRQLSVGFGRDISVEIGSLND
jgi:hypothetical protein